MKKAKKLTKQAPKKQKPITFKKYMKLFDKYIKENKHKEVGEQLIEMCGIASQYTIKGYKG